MWTVRWRWLVPMIVLIAGCLPRQAPAIPASFLAEVEWNGWGFEVATPPAGVRTGQALLRYVGDHVPSDMVLAQGVPTFGVLHCTDLAVACLADPEGLPGETTRTVWLIVYPHWNGPRGDVGWLVIDSAPFVRDHSFTLMYHDPFVEE